MCQIPNIERNRFVVEPLLGAQGPKLAHKQAARSVPSILPELPCGWRPPQSNRGGAALLEAPAMTTAQRQLYQALKTQKFELELTRDLLAGPVRDAVDRRIEAARILLDWLSETLEPQPAVRWLA
jgi:hypothetical protein